jgi:hypothetical protein
MLVWHGEPWLIDHGATMIWHHNWPGARASAAKPYDASDHVLASFAPDVAADVPDEWLVDEPGFDTADALRRAYVEALLPRAATIHERIALGERTEPGPSRAPGWLTDHLAPWPHPTGNSADGSTNGGPNSTEDGSE